GVLVGEVNVGCKTYTSQCDAIFDSLEKINKPGEVDIKFNRHDVYENASALDIEISFKNFPGGIQGKTMGTHHRGSPGGFFTQRQPARITFDFSVVGHAQQQRIVLHELGHAMGHVHMRNFTNSMMSYSED